MNKKNVTIALALTLLLGVGGVTYAASSDNTSNANTTKITKEHKGLGKPGKGMTGMKGFEQVETVLKDKFGVTADEIKAAKDAHKSMQDLIKEKGISEDAFKAAMLEAHNKQIDAAVADGKMTQEQADKMKANMKESCENGSCADGMKGKKGFGHDKGMPGMKGNEQVDAIITEKFGITADEIKAAKDAHKSMQDLIKEKGISEDAFKAAMLEARYKEIDKAVADGKMTKEEAEKIKADIKEKCEKGIPGEGMKNREGFKGKKGNFKSSQNSNTNNQ